MKISLLMVSALAFAGLLVGCQPHPPKPDHMIDMVANHIKGQLSLTDAQNAKLQDLVTTMKTLVAQREQAADPLRSRVEALISAPTLDTDQVRALVHDRQAAFQKDLDRSLDVVLPKLAGFTDSLTPDQKKKIVDGLEKMGKFWP